MKIVVERLEDFIELADTYRPAFMKTYIDVFNPVKCEIHVDAFSKYGMPIKIMLEEDCGKLNDEECKEIKFSNMKRYLETVFSSVYEGWIME